MIEDFKALSEKRKRWIDANEENEFQDGIEKLLTELYPDNAHFIYELLQNAEDAQANEVSFLLSEDNLEFSHNGKRAFTIKDVESITSIGKSTKKDDPTTIGKFGVGFKAVFSYTETPIIQSGNIKFRISQLVLPELLCELSELNPLTQFSFPFNHPTKPKETAFAEIKKGLGELDDTCLLFLKNIEKITICEDGNQQKRAIERIAKETSLIEIINDTKKSHWYLFDKIVSVNDEKKNKVECRICIAYHYDPKKHAIAPIDGKVSIFFPCEKEHSGLKFHIHAPFASTVARDSIRDCEENKQLIAGISELITDSLFWIKENQLLTTDFIAILPTKNQIANFYEPIHEKIVQKFKEEDLVPMLAGGYKKASNLYRVSDKDDINTLFDDEQLAALLNTKENKYTVPIWADSKDVTDFYNDLGIKQWKIGNVVSLLKEERCKEFLDKQTMEWHRKLYAYLEKKTVKEGSTFVLKNENNSNIPVNNVPIVRLKDGKYSIGVGSYFPKKGLECDDTYSLIEIKIYSYTTGNETEKEEAESSCKFLQKAGVKSIGEKEEIEMLLKQNYGRDNKQDIADIERFVSYFEKNPTVSKALFSNYAIFKTTINTWVKADMIYLDAPFLETGLNAFYGRIDIKKDYARFALNKQYANLEKIKATQVGEFAKEIGGIYELSIEKFPPIKNRRCPPENEWGGDIKDSKIFEDWTIEHLEPVLQSFPMTKELSKLIWDTLEKNKDKNHILKAKFRANQKQKTFSFDSELVNILKDRAWIPQQSENGIIFVKSVDAEKEKLPKGFDYVHGRKWLEAIDFGKEIEDKKRTEEFQQNQTHEKIKAKQEVYQELGADEEEIKKSVAFRKKMIEAGISDEKFNQMLEKQKSKPHFPTASSPNPERRQEKTKELYHNSPYVEYKVVSRSVRVSRNTINPKEQLENWYTNEEDEMVCQLCQEEMPFLKKDGHYFFYKQEVLKGFTKEIEANCIALCPNCREMYVEHIIRNSETTTSILLREEILKVGNEPIPLKINDKELQLRFVDKHRDDLRTTLQEEAKNKTN